MTNRISGEHPFVPRVINPVKIERAVIFAADSQIRGSGKALAEKMAWVETYVLPDPESVMETSSAKPTAFLFDDAGLALVDAGRVRSGNRNAVLVLLSYQPFIQCAPPQAAAEKYPYTVKADLVFAVDRNALLPETIVLAAVRAAEDRLNIEKHSGLKRFIFHVVDDEPRWFSQFLPVLYEIIGQRADVMITRTYEESLEFLFGEREDHSETCCRIPGERGQGDDVVCLITDIFFPRGGELQGDAGRDLIRLVNSRYPRIPVIIASKTDEALEMSGLGFVLPKGDPGSLEKLREYILRFTGMGDFFLFGEDGRELRRARTLREIYTLLLEAEQETQEGRRLRSALEAYGEKDKFSTWLYMHGYQELGDRLRPKRSQGRELIALLKSHLRDEISRMERTPLEIAGAKVFTLSELLEALQGFTPGVLQPYSDNDILSSWLDHKGYPEVAEELRPLHGSGEALKDSITGIVAKWKDFYRARGEA
ncbi:MAG: hypothetical protein JW747_09515 [Candidatus Aminicenantes bacterium]|nr:hypothetical protein [Candidatus Aminicenantes bacterium]